MKLKILSSAALAGMLAAAGCGGGAGSGGAIAPVGTSPGSGSGPSSHVRGGITKVSLLVPIPHADSSSTASSSSGSSRKPQFVSPGTWGIQVLLGDGVPYTSLSSAAAPAAGAYPTLAADQGGNQFVVFSNPTNAIVTPGTQQPPSAIPAQGIVNGGNSGSNGPANLQPTVYGNPGGATPATVSYSYGLSGTPGYYLFTLTFTGLTPNLNEKVSVALTDNPTHNYFVLSEGVSSYFNTPAATAVAQQVNLVLNPVLAKAFIVGPSAPVPVLTAPLTTVDAGTGPLTVAGYAYQFSVFAADNRGYPIPNQTGVSFDAGSGFSLAQTTAGGAAGVAATLHFAYGTETTSTASGLLYAANPINPLDPVPFNSGHAFDASYSAAASYPYTAAAPGSSTALVTTTGTVSALVVGDQIGLSAESAGVPVPHTITAILPSTVANATEVITFTPVVGATTASAAVGFVTLFPATTEAASTVTDTAKTWVTPGSLFTNVAFSQLTGIPALIPNLPTGSLASGYTEGHTVTVEATSSAPFTVAPVGTFVASTTIPGYQYTSLNYPVATAASAPITIGPAITVTPPTGVGVTIQ